MLKPYVWEFDDQCIKKYKPLKPTGRWMLRDTILYDKLMYIEVFYGPFGWFRKWVREDHIVFKESDDQEIFTCGKGE